MTHSSLLMRIILVIAGVTFSVAITAPTTLASSQGLHGSRGEFADLSAIACPSPSDCVAVGTRDVRRSGDWKLLAERWDGRKWTVDSIPNPVPPHGSGIFTAIEPESIACSSENRCLAVGFYWTHRLGYHPLAERWNGTRWFLTKAPKPSGGGLLGTVSCVREFFCVAVGYSDLTG